MDAYIERIRTSDLSGRIKPIFPSAIVTAAVSHGHKKATDIQRYINEVTVKLTTTCILDHDPIIYFMIQKTSAPSIDQSELAKLDMTEFPYIPINDSIWFDEIGVKYEQSTPIIPNACKHIPTSMFIEFMLLIDFKTILTTKSAITALQRFTKIPGQILLAELWKQGYIHIKGLENMTTAIPLYASALLLVTEPAADIWKAHDMECVLQYALQTTQFPSLKNRPEIGEGLHQHLHELYIRWQTSILQHSTRTRFADTIKQLYSNAVSIEQYLNECYTDDEDTKSALLTWARDEYRQKSDYATGILPDTHAYDVYAYAYTWIGNGTKSPKPTEKYGYKDAFTFWTAIAEYVQRPENEDKDISIRLKGSFDRVRTTLGHV
jgi:hypothetical protein